MRVLFWHELNPEVTGGAESWVADTATALRRRGHETAWLQSGQVDEALATFRPTHVVIGTIHNYVSDWVDRATRLADRALPAIWFMHDYWAFCLPRMLMREHNKSDRPCLAGEGGECDNECGGRVDYSRLLRCFPLATGCEGAAEIMRRHGVPVQYVVEESVDTELFRPGKREPLSYVIASAAWNAPWKGMAVAEEALAGTGLDLRLLSGLTREGVAEALRNAVLFAMPSLYQEIWGLALTEAMACGLACVASDVAGCRAQIHDGLGLPVPPHDAGALREAVLWLRDHPRERETMGQRARAHVVAEHGLEAAGRRWEGVLKQCAH